MELKASPGESLVGRSKVRTWALLALGATLVGLLNTSIVLTSELSEGHSVPTRYPLLHELTGAYAFLVLLPALLWFLKRFRFDRRNWARRLPLHLLASAVFGASHTLLMWGSRIALYRLLGWGAFDYGEMRYRFLMEYQKQVLLYAASAAVVAMVAASRASRERDLRASQLEQRLAEARLEALRMQLDPHFLFNTLNLVSACLFEDPKRADAMLSHLSHFLRLTLRAPAGQEVPLARELEFLNAYLEIMKARFQERLEVRLDVDPGALPGLVPQLLLQPLVENAVKHAMADHARPGRLWVAAERRDATLRLTVQDNGPGLSAAPAGAAALPRRGVGVSNTTERLSRLYGEAHRFEVVNAPEGGLRVVVEVPFRAGAAEAGA